ncbi:MAG: AraC family transcriptional regulator [Planctomycetales bacterium]
MIVESGSIHYETHDGETATELPTGSLTFFARNQCTLSPSRQDPASLTGSPDSVVIGTRVSETDDVSPTAPTVVCLAVKWLSPRVGHPLVSGKQQTLSSRGGGEARWISTTLQTLLDEAESPDFEGSRLADLLTQTLIGLVCRPRTEQYADSISPHERQAWAHPEIGPVLRDIQQQPEYNWTVASMADRVQISRSSFAAKFTDLVGIPPMKYLLQCRMSKAAQLITEGRYRFKQIAGKVGYKTEAAFNTAFKRWSGVSPGEYRRFAASYRPPV